MPLPIELFVILSIVCDKGKEEWREFLKNLKKREGHFKIMQSLSVASTVSEFESARRFSLNFPILVWNINSYEQLCNKNKNVKAFKILK